MMKLNCASIGQRKCKVKDCNGKHRARGYCSMHYGRLIQGRPINSAKESLAKSLPSNCVALSSGKFAIIDEGDREIVSQYNWFYDPKGYAATTIPRKTKKQTLYMHRLIFFGSADVAFVESTTQIDHIDMIGLNNRRLNLRQCDKSQNAANRRLVGGSSKFKGVSHLNSSAAGDERWAAYIGHKNKTYNLGSFYSQEDAAIAYNVAAQFFFGEFAYLNDV